MHDDEYWLLRPRAYILSYRPDERITPYLDAARFGIAILVWMFDLRADLISSLVERWFLKNHTFHLPYGECTITLEDVTMKLRLPVDGDAVTRPSKVAEPSALYYSYLDVRLVMGKLDLPF
ncbi:hypothetical protein PVK06_001535 [Gossypium arboreum]|uniref:Aminotransferase-like plant mobile domain-containing protein n=1 Tax=Gossypium arboreum TaxID=29729 RepID=A0ABR0R2L2_GOSAR|nr:hypothetical protein PVK06_001535 [Gossypium arboreum]